MSEYRSITGAELARVLAGAGWNPDTEGTCAEGFVVLWNSGNSKPISLTLAFPIGKNRVEKICRKAGVSPERFAQLYLEAPEPSWLIKPANPTSYSEYFTDSGEITGS
ncbi:MAG TPA: hypothetical protein VGD94_19055 [Vicinamibacterales bacterium]